MALVKQFDKRVGITYVYESESYYDPEKHQSRSRRKLIGKLDPETGEIIPTGSRGRPSKDPVKADSENIDYKALYQKSSRSAEELECQVASLKQELTEAKSKLRGYELKVKKIMDVCTS